MSFSGDGDRILTGIPLLGSGSPGGPASRGTGPGGMSPGGMTLTAVLLACLISGALASVPQSVSATTAALASVPHCMSAATGGPVSAPEGVSVATGGQRSSPVIAFTEPGEGAPLPHDLHVTYGNLGVEGATAILQVRIFRNDLEEALRRLSPGGVVEMEVSPDVDALFLRYLSRSFRIEVEGAVLDGRIVGSGDDELDREPVWWYQIQYTAPAPILAARVTNKLLFEIFDDQRNVLRVVKFPQESRQAFYFAPGEETAEIEF